MMPEKLVQHGLDAWMDGWVGPVIPWGRAVPKKLIEYGSGRPSPAYVVEHVREMEEKPFDGVLMQVGGCGQIFRTREFDDKAFATDMEALNKIKWGKFTDNFIMMYAASDMDWFSDEDWAPDGWVLRNVGMCARAARAGRCVGVCFDPESYGHREPWTYGEQPHAGKKSFAEFRRIVRKRGAQFVSRLQEEFPDIVMHTFFLSSIFQYVTDEPDPAKREELLKGEAYGLLPAFLNGMLDAADLATEAAPGTIITDGNEYSYYYSRPLHFYQGYHDIRQTTARTLVPPEVRSKYCSQVQCAHAIFGANLCNLRTFRTASSCMTPEERAKFVEHNVYWALRTSDRYVWFFSMRMNWWTGENIPPYLAQAIQSAREKVARGEPLGFDLSEIWERAHAELAAALSDPIIRIAQIPRLGKGVQPPMIDGKIEDPAWNEEAALEPFVPFLAARDYDLIGKTRTWMTFDEENLYIAFLCEEPEMDKVSSSTFRDEYSFGSGRIVIAIGADAKPTAYYHIVVDCDNKRWDSLTEAGDEIYGADSSWTGEYRTATHKAEDHWSVEIAIPWKTLDMEAPKAGAKLKGNLFRWRHPRPDHVQEISSWSQNRRHRYLEAENFGTWVLK